MQNQKFLVRQFVWSLLVLTLIVSGCGEFPAPDPEPNLPSANSDATPPTPYEPPEFEGDPGETFQVAFQTSAGNFVVEVNPSWAPLGARRFRELVEAGYFDDNRFFRVVPNFMVQWGLNGDPDVTALWRNRNIPDEPVKQSNARGTITFAKTDSPNSRTTQLFINFANNSRLDEMGFSPFGRVVQGMDVVDSINAKYGERPDQGQIQSGGNAYLNEIFPDLDYIKSARIVEASPAKTPDTPGPARAESRD